MIGEVVTHTGPVHDTDDRLCSPKCIVMPGRGSDPRLHYESLSLFASLYSFITTAGWSVDGFGVQAVVVCSWRAFNGMQKAPVS